MRSFDTFVLEKGTGSQRSPLVPTHVRDQQDGWQSSRFTFGANGRGRQSVRVCFLHGISPLPWATSLRRLPHLG